MSDADDYNEIVPYLWMGGCPVIGAPLDPSFESVVVCVNHFRWDYPATTMVFDFPFQDGYASELPPLARLEEVVDQRIILPINLHIRTLVHCQAGLNRSGLLVALALIRGVPDYYQRPDDAIKLLREKRSPCCVTGAAGSSITPFSLMMCGR